ncbi:type II toxin-antitoxin system RelE/ParE family toxin [Streptomyces sp. NPDC058067]|uniref:type II toxin-antitoxin system RelE/ParE family toxin n=1 Tax=Streptomyces sp. NPDC058067 TaxID=3346324 RepID=UPI0036E8004D
MSERYVIEVEPEVRLWLLNLSPSDYETAEFAADRLSERAATLGEPHSRHLGSGVRELRFNLGPNRDAARVTYWLAPSRRVVLLTVFRKTKDRETAEVERAQRAKAVCEAEHEPAHLSFSREV